MPLAEQKPEVALAVLWFLLVHRLRTTALGLLVAVYLNLKLELEEPGAYSTSYMLNQNW